MRVDIPSERKFEIYHAVVTQLMSRRDAARRFGISATRVQQVVNDVQLFVVRHGGDVLLTMPAEHLELGALNVCHQKLSFFYGQVMRQWRSEMNQGSSSARLLQAAARLSIEQAKLAGRIAKVRLTMQEAGTLEPEVYEYAYADDEDDVDEDNVEEDDELEDSHDPATPTGEDSPATLAITPPAGGCTAANDPAYQQELQAMLDVLAKNDDKTGCDAIVDAIVKRGDAKAREKTPVQRR